MQVNPDATDDPPGSETGLGEETGNPLETGETGETDPPVHEWQLDAVAPPWGSNAGGDELVLSGSGFTGDVRVQMNGENVSVSAWSESELTVTSPAFSGTGLVSVTAVLGESEEKLPDAFTYYEDATGLAAGSGIINNFEYMGQYWGNAQDFGAGSFQFWESPRDLQVGDVAWGVNSGCEMDITPNHPNPLSLDADVMALVGGG